MNHLVAKTNNLLPPTTTSSHLVSLKTPSTHITIMEALPQETATTIDIAAALALRDGDYRGAHQQIDNFLALLVIYSACP